MEKRLSNLMDTVVKANLDYFHNCGYETAETRTRVIIWLDNPELIDQYAQNKVITWLYNDALWLKAIRHVVIRRAWPLALILWPLMWHIRDRFLWWARKLSGGMELKMHKIRKEINESERRR